MLQRTTRSKTWINPTARLTPDCSLKEKKKRAQSVSAQNLPIISEFKSYSLLPGFSRGHFMQKRKTLNRRIAKFPKQFKLCYLFYFISLLINHVSLIIGTYNALGRSSLSQNNKPQLVITLTHLV